MTTMRLITPSYRPDFELFSSLHRSVLRYTESDVQHEVIVPAQDVSLFRSIASPRLIVSSARSFQPRSFLPITTLTQPISRIPGLRALGKVQVLNLKRPWLPIRGWVLQQLMKLEAAARTTTDVVLIVDSDVELIAPLRAADLVDRGIVRFYAQPSGVHKSMTDHVAWHRSARELLRVGPIPPPPFDDYVAACVSWDPRLIRSMLAEVSTIGKTHWMNVAGSELHFSECTLYGVYVTELASAHESAFRSPSSGCVSHWDPTPLDSVQSEALLGRLTATDFAVQIQSTSNTSASMRQDIIRQCRQRWSLLNGTTS